MDATLRALEMVRRTLETLHHYDRLDDTLSYGVLERFLADLEHVRSKKHASGASVLKCEQITTLRKDLIDPEPAGPPLADRQMAAVERGVLRAIGVPIPLEHGC